MKSMAHNGSCVDDQATAIICPPGLFLRCQVGRQTAIELAAELMMSRVARGAN